MNVLNHINRLILLGANTGTDVLKQLKSGTRSTDKYLTNLDTNGTAAFQDTYTLLFKIGVYGAVLMFICGMIMFMVAGSAQDRAQAKKKVSWILIGLVLLYMAALIVGWIYTAGKGNFG